MIGGLRAVANLKADYQRKVLRNSVAEGHGCSDRAKVVPNVRNHYTTKILFVKA